jgi:succinyl-diaminopimelate desuccinylase
MKSGVAVALRLAAAVREPVRDVTYVFYDNEEVDAAKNGLGRVVENHPTG